MRTMPIAGAPEYRVTDSGRVQSLWTGRGRSARVSADTWRDLAGRLDDAGYVMVNIRRYGHKRCVRVHRLVAEAFIPNPDGLPLVRRLNHDGADNRVSNLAWGTHQDNTDDKRTNGTYGLRTGRITPEQRQRMFDLRRDGASQSAIATALGVGQATVSRVLNGVSWATPHTDRELALQAARTTPGADDD